MTEYSERISMRDDQQFSDSERRTLVAVLDEIIPPSRDGRLPSAGRAEGGGYIERALRALPDLRLMITAGLGELEATAQNRYGQSFPAVDRDDRAALLSEQGFVFPLTLHTYAGYYQAPAVVEALGLE